MKLFSESVKFTNTSSTQNILQVESFEEVFFDVFEVEINKTKYHVEKVGTYEGQPVVSVPVVLGEQKIEYPFILYKGKFNVLFNKHNTQIPVSENINDYDTDEFVSYEERKDQLQQELLLAEQSKKKILKEIADAKQKSLKNIKLIKEKKLLELTKDQKAKEQALNKVLSDAKSSLVEEFINISNNLKHDIVDINSSNWDEINISINNRISVLAEDLKQNLGNDFNTFESTFDSKLKKCIIEMYDSLVTPKLSKDIEQTTSALVEEIKELKTDVNDKFSTKADVVIVEELCKDLDTLYKSNVELNDSFNKKVNKALSRIGQVNNRVDDLTVAVTEELDNKITEVETNLTNYYTEKLEKVEEKALDLTEETRKILVDLIQESKNSLISDIRKIQNEPAVQYVIESNGKKQVKDLDSINKELEKKISDKISDEVGRLRKYVAYYGGGGGSVAVQYAAGGVINGDLVVTGSLSASNFSGGGGGAGMVVSDTPPPNPKEGMGWWRSLDGRVFYYYDGWWVESGSQGCSTGNKILSDYNAPYDYMGISSPLSLTSEPVWKITRFTIDNAGTITETKIALNAIWDNRYTTTYY